MSEYAVRQFRAQHAATGDAAALERKMEVLYPAVTPRARHPKDVPERLHLLFVGNDFMRKGCPALIRAHEQLRARGIPVETTVVSSMQWSPQDYIGPPREPHMQAEKARLDQNGVTVTCNLRNDEVRVLMDQATFLVLPTFHDTFGFVAIEALAGGTPVIGTATCALPEIVEDGQSGFLLPFENDEVVGKWRWTYHSRRPGYEQAYRDGVDAIARSLTDRLSAWWDERHAYPELSAGAIRRATGVFSRDAASVRLATLYNTACMTGEKGQ
jgi:glycosyltransferase involved in cell wall biosynthesis